MSDKVTIDYEKEIEQIEREAEERKQNVIAKQREIEQRKQKEIQEKRRKELEKAKTEFLYEIKQNVTPGDTDIFCPACCRRPFSKQHICTDGFKSLIGIGHPLYKLKKIDNGNLQCPACKNVYFTI